MRLLLTFLTYLLPAPRCVSAMELDRWDGGERVPGCLKFLRLYGIHGKEVLPRLRERSRRADGKNKDLDKLIADIETTTDTLTLVDLKDPIAHASANGDSATHKKKGTAWEISDRA